MFGRDLERLVMSTGIILAEAFYGHFIFGSNVNSLACNNNIVKAITFWNGLFIIWTVGGQTNLLNSYFNFKCPAIHIVVSSFHITQERGHSSCYTFKSWLFTGLLRVWICAKFLTKFMLLLTKKGYLDVLQIFICSINMTEICKQWLFPASYRFYSQFYLE